MGFISETDRALLKHKRILPLCWILLATVVLTVDYSAGPVLQFPVFFLFPVMLASWYSGRLWGFFFAISLPLIRLYFYFIYEEKAPWTFEEALTNAMIRMFVFTIFAYLIDRTARQTRALEREVEVLGGLLPICSFCKKIRDKEGEWQQMEMYIAERSEAQFSHSLCPDCLKKNYGDVVRDRG